MVLISASRKNWLLFVLVAALSCGGLAKKAATADSSSAPDFDGDDSRRSLIREFFALVAASTEDQELDSTTTTADSTATASPNAEFAQECPLHDDDQDVFYCADPSLIYEIPCLAETCQWDLSFLDITAPPGLCALIQLDEERLSTGRIPDTLKPCVLWESLFGTLFQPTASPTQPTFSPSPTMTVPPPNSLPSTTNQTATTPTSAPVTGNGVYAVIYDTIFVNLFLLLPIATVETGFGTNGGSREELKRVTSSHILNHVRSVVNEPDLVVAAKADITTVSTLAPWQNATVVSSHSVSGSVHFHVNYGRPIAAGVNTIVQNAFKGAALLQYLAELELSSDEVLQGTQSVYVGLPSDILSTTTTTSTTPEATQGDQDEYSEAADEEDEWIQWGDWSDTDFVVFVAVAGSAALVAIFYVVGRCFGFGGRRKDVGIKPPIVTHSKSSETAPVSPDCAEKQQPESVNNVTNPINGLGISMDAVIGEGGQVDDQQSKKDIEIEQRSESSRCDISDVTSVYSYIDSRSILNELDETAYDVNGSYNPQILGNGDEESGQWSLTTGEIVRVSTMHVGTGPVSVAETLESAEASSRASNRAPAAIASSLEASEGPMIFSDTSGDSGEMASSTPGKDTAEDGTRPTTSRVASVIATFEAGVSKSAKSSPLKNNDADASFPDGIESSILLLAPDTPGTAPVSPNKEQEAAPSPAGSVSGKQLTYASRENSVDGEREHLSKDASTRSRTSSAAVSSSTSTGKEESSTVPTTISLQNSDKSDETKHSKRSATTDKHSTASFVLRSKPADKGDETVLPTTISVQKSVGSDASKKVAKAPKVISDKNNETKQSKRSATTDKHSTASFVLRSKPADKVDETVLPTTISVQNPVGSDGSKKPPTGKHSTASFVLRSKPAEKGDDTVLPTTVSVQNSVGSDDSKKEAKAPKTTYVMRSKTWGSRVYNAETKPNEGEDAVSREPLHEAPKNSKGFPFRGFGLSKATQMVLSASKKTTTTTQIDRDETRSNPSTLSENQSILETDSDIQSLCSLDNHSMFSFGAPNKPKGGNSLLYMHGSSPYMQGTGLTGDDDDDEEED